MPTHSYTGHQIRHFSWCVPAALDKNRLGKSSQVVWYVSCLKGWKKRKQNALTSTLLRSAIYLIAWLYSYVRPTLKTKNVLPGTINSRAGRRMLPFIPVMIWYYTFFCWFSLFFSFFFYSFFFVFRFALFQCIWVAGMPYDVSVVSRTMAWHRNAYSIQHYDVRINSIFVSQFCESYLGWISNDTGCGDHRTFVSLGWTSTNTGCCVLDVDGYK